MVSSPSSCFSCVGGTSAIGGAGSPFMYQASRVAGLDRPDVQLTCTLSPIWYRRRDPVIVGPWSGRAGGRENIVKYGLFLITMF